MEALQEEGTAEDDEEQGEGQEGERRIRTMWEATRCGLDLVVASSLV
jgi:hypothetical protein